MAIQLRTNIVFVGFFATLIPTFACLAAALWRLARGRSDAIDLQKTAGGFAFACALLGWYLFLAQMLLVVDFPIKIPVGDLTQLNLLKPRHLGKDGRHKSGESTV